MKRIQFLAIRESVVLSDVLQAEFSLSKEQALFLISFGAIYGDGQRLIKDQTLQGGEILRCHLRPKRYRTHIDWPHRILHNDEDFIVINKPAGLPCQPSLDNRIENLLFQLSAEFKQELFITHRLDIGTSGLVVLAKTKIFQTAFNRLLEKREAVKIYQAYTLGPALASGLYRHWMRPDPRAPKILSDRAQDGWKPCELELLAHRSVTPQNISDPLLKEGLKEAMKDTLTRERQVARNLEQQVDPTETLNPAMDDKIITINQYQIQLHTGRTHQIRAQLSFLQNPILGDSLYDGLHLPQPFEWHSLTCHQLRFCWRDSEFNFGLPTGLPRDCLLNINNGYLN